MVMTFHLLCLLNYKLGLIHYKGVIMKVKFISLLILVTMVSACTSTEMQDVSVKNTEISEAGTSIADTDIDKPMDTLAFADISIFDKELSKTMKTNRDEIEVAIISKFTTNDIPTRLGKWFYMVDKYGGKVEIKSTDPTKRGIPGIGAGVSLMISAINVIRDKIIYSPSRHYNATLLYQPESGIVEKIIFKRKP